MSDQFSGKRPVMFFQNARGTWGALSGPRIRIFYPNGTAEWCALQSGSEEYEFQDPPCWLKKLGHHRVKRPRSMKRAMEMAREFDQDRGFPEMEFLGEL